jgi:diacylglycerol kinase
MRNKFLGTGEPGYHPIRKVKVWLSGLWFAMTHEFTVAYKVALSLMALVLCIILHDWLDFLLIFLATGQVLMAELFNTSIEAVCDYLQDKEDQKIRVIKDVAAAAVGVSMVVWLVVLVLWIDRMIINHFFP